MRFTQCTIGGWLPAYASAVIGCSGSAANLLTDPPDARTGDADSIRDVSVLIPDAFAEPQAPASSQSTSEGSPVVSRADHFAPDDAGRLSAASSADGALGVSGSDGESSALDAGLSFDDDATTGGSCAVLFTVTNAIVDGIVVTNVVIGGDVAAFGDWDASDALRMSPVSGAMGDWTLRADLPAGHTVAFKFGMTGNSGKSVLWEFGPTATTDRMLTVSCPDGSVLSYVGEYNHIPTFDGGL